MKLIYHPVASTKGTSPFDEALQEVAQDAPLLRLASPYIGLTLLQRIIDLSDDWRLLSDVEAWLQSGNRKHRARCWEFIADNLDRIRHVGNLHAKVAIGNGRLFLGSANFTEKGLLGRAELSMLVTEPDVVNESTAWFDDLWAVASPPVLEEGDALVSALDSLEWTQPKVRVKLTTTAPQIAAVMADTKRPEGFDLAGVMAKAGITESVQLGSLAEAYQRISEEWAAGNRTFTFRELLEAVNRFSMGSAREVMYLVTTDTANHWLGGLDPEGFDRYVYENGKFRLFRNPDDNGAAIQPAKILNFLVERIPTYPDREPLPLEDEWLEIGVAASQILPVIEPLLQCEFLIEHDIPGEIESYSLSQDFEWPRRWNKFTKAHSLYSKAISEATDPEAEERFDEFEVDSEDDEYPDESSVRVVVWDRKVSPLAPAKKASNYMKEVARVAAKKEIPVTELLALQDKALSAFIEVLAELPEPIQLARGQIDRELMAQQIPQALRAEFVAHDRVLNSASNSPGLIINTKWDAADHLVRYPKALAAWKALITSRNNNSQASSFRL